MLLHAPRKPNRHLSLYEKIFPMTNPHPFPASMQLGRAAAAASEDALRREVKCKSQESAPGARSLTPPFQAEVLRRLWVPPG